MTFELPLSWCAGAGRITTRYLRTVTGLAGGADASVSDGPAPPAAATGMIVLEPEAGGIACALFVVKNHLRQPVSTPLALCALTDARGRVPTLQLRFEPDAVTLEPDEHVLVRVFARIDEGLADAFPYHGAVALPGLSGAELPIVVRQSARLPSAGVANTGAQG